MSDEMRNFFGPMGHPWGHCTKNNGWNFEGLRHYFYRLLAQCSFVFALIMQGHELFSSLPWIIGFLCLEWMNSELLLWWGGDYITYQFLFLIDSAWGDLMYSSTICFHLRLQSQPLKKLCTFLILAMSGSLQSSSNEDVRLLRLSNLAPPVAQPLLLGPVLPPPPPLPLSWDCLELMWGSILHSFFRANSCKQSRLYIWRRWYPLSKFNPLRGFRKPDWLILKTSQYKTTSFVHLHFFFG